MFRQTETDVKWVRKQLFPCLWQELGTHMYLPKWSHHSNLSQNLSAYQCWRAEHSVAETEFKKKTVFWIFYNKYHRLIFQQVERLECEWLTNTNGSFSQVKSSGLRPGSGMYLKVKLWLGSYISCYICFTKLKFFLIIKKLDLLPCLNPTNYALTYYIDHVTWHMII